MNDTTGDSGLLHELELNVRAELTQAETSEPAGARPDDWLFDPADAPREEAALRSLLGAVESLEEPS